MTDKQKLIDDAKKQCDSCYENGKKRGYNTPYYWKPCSDLGKCVRCMSGPSGYSTHYQCQMHLADPSKQQFRCRDDPLCMMCKDCDDDNPYCLDTNCPAPRELSAPKYVGVENYENGYREYQTLDQTWGNQKKYTL